MIAVWALPQLQQVGGASRVFFVILRPCDFSHTLIFDISASVVSVGSLLMTTSRERSAGRFKM